MDEATEVSEDKLMNDALQRISEQELRESFTYCLLSTLMEYEKQQMDLEHKKSRNFEKLTKNSGFVPGAGLEPARVLPQWCLRPSRLPIPPPGHFSCGLQKYGILFFIQSFQIISCYNTELQSNLFSLILIVLIFLPLKANSIP